MTWSRTSLVTLGLSLTGLAIAAYLTWAHYQHDALVCGLGDCQTVQASKYAEVAGVPIAILGVGMFAAVIGLVTVRSWKPAIADLASVSIIFMTLTGVLYYAYLTWIEVFELEAICQWCVLSSLMTVGILVNETRDYLRSMNGE
jgi:uncharacterized membrane protein